MKSKIKQLKIDNSKLKIKDILFFILATTVILGLNLTPLILQTRHSPPKRTFTLIHNNTQDYYFYQSLMNEGANGAILTYDPYTSEPHQPSIIFSYFLWLGKLSKILGLSYAVTYHLTRIFLSILFLFFIFYFLFFISAPYPRLTYLFFLFAAPFMHTINDYGTFRSVPFMSWWNGIDPIRRAAFLPHHMLGGLFLILSIIFIFKYMNKPARKYLFWLVLMSFAMAFVHTPSLLIILLIIPPSCFIYLLLNISKASSAKIKNQSAKPSANLKAFNFKLGFDLFTLNFEFVGLIIYWFIGLFFLFAMILQTKSGFPWSQYIDWEKNLQFPLDRELIGALGILFPFSLIGIFSAIKSKKFENVFMACWLVVPFLFIPIAPKLNLSNIRLIQGVPYLPLAILAVLGIKTIENLFAQHFLESAKRKNQSAKPSVNLKAFNFKLGFEIFTLNFEFNSSKISKLSLLIIVTIFSVFTIPTLKWSLQDQIREYWPIYGNVYLDNRLFGAFNFINRNYPPKIITLSTFYSGNYLPAYTNTVSFIGHFGYTYNEQAKEKETQKFFAGQMSLEEAKNFLLRNKITLVFQGPEEKPLYGNYLYPALLKPVYDKEEATIYVQITKNR